MTFTEHHKQVIKLLGADIAGKRTFWINLPMPEKNAGYRSTPAPPPSPSTDELEHQEFFTEENAKTGGALQTSFPS